jgi:hypothetical protein
VRQRGECSGLEKLLLKPVNLKAFVLGAGLSMIGLVGTSAMAEDVCKQNHNGTVSNDSKHCRGENHMYTMNKSCICPNPNNSRDPNQEFTKKCKSLFEEPLLGYVYTCEKP